MIESVSNKVTKLLVENRIIKESQSKVFCYCLEITIVLFVCYSILLLLSIVFDEIKTSFIFIFTFSFFRKICGGYHTSNYIKCSIVSFLSYLLFIVIIKNKELLDFVNSYYIVIPSLLIICIYSPVQTEKKPLTEKQYKYFSIISKTISLLLISIILISSIYKIHLFTNNKYYFSFYYGIGLVAFSLFIAKLKGG